MSHWTIIKDFEANNRKMVEVVCTCGNTGVRRKDHVLNGRTRMCKNCASKETAKKHGTPNVSKAIGELSKTFYSTIEDGAKKRNIEFNVSQQYLWDLFVKQDQKCNLTGQPINLSAKSKNCNPDYSKFTASLDRIDSTKGYVEGNVQWVHKVINRFKNKYSMSNFLAMCEAVYLYHKK